MQLIWFNSALVTQGVFAARRRKAAPPASRDEMIITPWRHPVLCLHKGRALQMKELLSGQADDSCLEEQMHRDESRWDHFNIKTSFALVFCAQRCLSQPQMGAHVLLGLPGSTFFWEWSLCWSHWFSAEIPALNADFYWKRISQIPSSFAPRVKYFECIWSEMICEKNRDEWKAPRVSPNPSQCAKFCDE